MRVSNGREKAIDKLVGKWADSFHFLYIFKAEVEKCSLGCVVDIDRHTVQYKVRGVTKEEFCKVCVCSFFSLVEKIMKWVTLSQL
jgi:hypothetical protein